MRATLLEYFPALERAFDYSKNKAALTLLSRYATPASLRRIGTARLADWLKSQGCRNSAGVAEAAVAAAHAQHTVLATEAIGATLVAKLADQITAIDADLASIDAKIAEHYAQHQHAEILLSLPGFGIILAATFLAQIGGNLDNFDSVDRLACVAGLPPSHATPGASTAISTGHADLPVGCCEPATWRRSRASKNSADPERFTTANATKASHRQALIALARRRINVIWAMLRDHTPYTEPAPTSIPIAARQQH